jgi:predicted glycosyltransferase involved in capsule biosynthesis
MINLKDCTFIIPLRIEHDDRYRNAFSVLGFLNHHFETNVIIYEISRDGESKLDFLQELGNLEISHSVHRLHPMDFFHRTEYLNIMLDKVKTPVVVNYDIDVILPVESYVECRDSILKGEVDVYYPYVFGLGQYRIEENINRKKFHLSYNPEDLLEEIIKRGTLKEVPLYPSEYGHCIFFNTSEYRKFGWENEEFRSYGPEDRERSNRFKKLGKEVKWFDGKVFHFEHWRGNDSSRTNPHLDNNHKLLDTLESMSSEELLNYYDNVEYRKKYKTL